MSTYTKFYNQWFNKPNKTTPATAEAMNHIENGILTASEEANRSLRNLTAVEGSDPSYTVDGLPYRKPSFNGLRNSGDGILVQPHSEYATPETIAALKRDLPSGGEGSTFYTYPTYDMQSSIPNPETTEWTYVVWLDKDWQGSAYLLISAYKFAENTGCLLVAAVTDKVDNQLHHKQISYDINKNWLYNALTGNKFYNDIVLTYNGVDYPMEYFGNASSQQVVYKYMSSGQEIPYTVNGPIFMYKFKVEGSQNPYPIPENVPFFSAAPQLFKLEKYVPIINDVHATASNTYSANKIEALFNEISSQLYGYDSRIASLEYALGIKIDYDIQVASPEDPQTWEPDPTQPVDLLVFLNRASVTLIQAQTTDADHIVYDVLTGSATVGGHTVTVTITPPATTSDLLVLTLTADQQTETFNIEPYDGQSTTSGYAYWNSGTFNFT